jgi:hypothetical protein
MRPHDERVVFHNSRCILNVSGVRWRFRVSLFFRQTLLMCMAYCWEVFLKFSFPLSCLADLTYPTENMMACLLKGRVVKPAEIAVAKEGLCKDARF